MRHRLVAAEARERHRLSVRFDDGLEFACVTVDAESGASTWPGGLDVAPDAIHRELSASP